MYIIIKPKTKKNGKNTKTLNPNLRRKGNTQKPLESPKLLSRIVFVDGVSWKRFNNEKADVYLVDKECEIHMFICFSVMVHEFYGWLQMFL